MLESEAAVVDIIDAQKGHVSVLLQRLWANDGVDVSLGLQLSDHCVKLIVQHFLHILNLIRLTFNHLVIIFCLELFLIGSELRILGESH